ncbi:hypothetical protein EVAR_79365_1 [Eumeta japonica]|uniref:Uncharacterized protein n=1 Tax=Eumeta variegata TaxID=151549 RepID=A0A4C1TFQ3_EUMVA|nr:hypothetical protein EVAR_79365_1 [Eumeta japonica]
MRHAAPAAGTSACVRSTYTHVHINKLYIDTRGDGRTAVVSTSNRKLPGASADGLFRVTVKISVTVNRFFRATSASAEIAAARDERGRGGLQA